VSGEQQEFLAVDVVAEHDLRRWPIQAGVDAFAKFHGGATGSKIEVFIGIEGDQRGCPGHVDESRHRCMCGRTGVDPALQHHHQQGRRQRRQSRIALV
jgi:hypothetical protein